MKFLADESVDRHIVERLREDGHELLYIAELEPSISDDAVLSRANEAAAILLTADKDFGEIVFRDERLSSGGVVLIRLVGLSSEKKCEIVAEEISKNLERLPHCFSVITPGNIRIRAKRFV